MERFTRVRIKREVTKQLPDNDVLLGFFDDDGAYAFMLWWETKGNSAFYEWLKNDNDFNYLCSEQ